MDLLAISGLWIGIGLMALGFSLAAPFLHHR
jgi:hypothetical protein